MSEHWTIWVCPDCGATNMHASACGAFPGEPVEHGNRVEVVPLATYEGAVKERDALHEVVEFYAGDGCDALARLADHGDRARAALDNYKSEPRSCSPMAEPEAAQSAWQAGVESVRAMHDRDMEARDREVERLRERFHEYVRLYGRLGYDGPHLDHFLETGEPRAGTPEQREALKWARARGGDTPGAGPRDCRRHP